MPSSGEATFYMTPLSTFLSSILDMNQHKHTVNMESGLGYCQCAHVRLTKSFIMFGKFERKYFIMAENSVTVNSLGISFHKPCGLGWLGRLSYSCNLRLAHLFVVVLTDNSILFVLGGDVVQSDAGESMQGRNPKFGHCSTRRPPKSQRAAKRRSQDVTAESEREGPQ